MAIPSKKAIEELGLLPYDVIDYLQTPEDRAGYLDVWLEESPRTFEAYRVSSETLPVPKE